MTANKPKGLGMKKPTGKLAFAYASISNLEEQIDELKRQNEALQTENDRLNRYYKNGIECFANPCEKHSGEGAPSFSEFFEEYGGQCLICVVDSNKALQAELQKLHRMAQSYMAISTRASQLSERVENQKETIFNLRQELEDLKQVEKKHDN